MATKPLYWMFSSTLSTITLLRRARKIVWLWCGKSLRGELKKMWIHSVHYMQHVSFFVFLEAICVAVVQHYFKCPIFTFYKHIYRGLKEDMAQPLLALEGHQRRVGIVEWHPTADNVLLSAGFDYMVCYCIYLFPFFSAPIVFSPMLK